MNTEDDNWLVNQIAKERPYHLRVALENNYGISFEITSKMNEAELIALIEKQGGDKQL
jgi:hypothetical protein